MALETSMRQSGTLIGWVANDTYVVADVEALSLGGAELLRDEAGSDLEGVALRGKRGRVLGVEFPCRVLVCGAVGDALAEGRMRVGEDGSRGEHWEEGEECCRAHYG